MSNSPSKFMSTASSRHQARLTLRKGERNPGIEDRPAGAGSQPHCIQHPREGRNQHCRALEASVKAKDDSFDANNTFRQPVVVNGRPRILYVESHEASAQYLRRALESEGLIVDVIAPESSASRRSPNSMPMKPSS